VSAIRRFDLAAFVALWRKELPRPVDVPNLIERSADGGGAYRWYALLVLPVLLVLGARLLWAGRVEKVVAGEAQAEELLVVRYRSHRRFLLMVTSPYYLLINPLRERAVAKFQAAFARPSLAAEQETAPARGLRRYPVLYGLHMPAAVEPAAEERVAGALGGTVVYRSEQVATIDFLRDPSRSDPHPLALPRIALLAAAGALDDSATAAAVAALPEGAALHRYGRMSATALLLGRSSGPAG
jgi:uncharacterized protein (DUF1330 family)